MTENLWVQETFLDAEKGYITGESPVYETYIDDLGEMFRVARSEHGRCIGKVYINGPDDKPIQIGWTFVKRRRYDDSNDTYLQEVWVTVHEAPDTVTRTAHYVTFPK
jgi:hypothetical protein